VRPLRRRLVIASVAVLALATAKIVSADLAALHRRAEGRPVPAGPAVTTTSSSVPGADIPPGMRAVRVQVTPAWKLPPGAVVDLLAALDGPGLGGDLAPVVARGAVVLSQSSPDRKQDSSPTGENTGEVTVLVTVDTARRVASAAAAGPLALALAPPEDACCTKSPSASSRG
jgi:hypothetical protein